MFKKRPEPANDGSSPRDGIHRFYLIIIDNYYGKNKLYQDPNIFTYMTLAWRGGWKIGLSDLSAEHQRELVECGAVVVDGNPAPDVCTKKQS